MHCFAERINPSQPNHLNPTESPPLLQGHYEAAREKYMEALTTLGYQADLAYNIALCHFKLKQFGPALKFIMEIIEVCTCVRGWECDTIR